MIKMQLRFICVLALAMIFGLIATSRPAACQAGRLTEPTGGFSYSPPPGWKIRTFPGLKYKICYAAPAHGFAPNIDVVDETAPMSLAEYMRVSMTHMHLVYAKFHVVTQGAFLTSSSLHGVRLVSNGTINGKNVRQIFYVFPAAKNRKIVVTVSWLASDGNKYTAASDGAMKSFRLL
jgi:hypothetical protein